MCSWGERANRDVKGKPQSCVEQNHQVLCELKRAFFKTIVPFPSYFFFLLSLGLGESALAKTYPTEPTDPAQWKGLVDSLGDKTYTIQKGDNLWTLSKIFFGDPDYWSKLWAQNKDIWFNPHKISPGDVLVFDLGSYERPPSVRIVKAEELASGSVTSGADVTNGDVPNSQTAPSGALVGSKPGTSSGVESDSGVTTEAATDGYSPIGEYMSNKYPKPETVKLSELGALPEAPPEVKRPPMRALPESLPDWVGREIPDHKIQYQDATVQRQIPPAQEWLSCYVDPQQIDEPERVGELVGVQDGMNAAHEGQLVFIQSQKNLNIGQVYSVTSWKKVKLGDDRVGVIQIFGSIQITKALSSGYWEGIVIYALHPLELGAGISERFSLSSFQPQAISGAFMSYAGEVHSGYCDESRHVFGSGEIIFVRYLGGPKPSVGTQFAIHRGRKTSGLVEPVDKKTELIAVGQVVRVIGDWITAYLLDSVSEVRSGDRTRPEE